MSIHRPYHVHVLSASVISQKRNRTGREESPSLTTARQDPTPRGITHLLSGHKGAVKAVKFLPGPPAGGDEDGSVGGGDRTSSSYLLSGGDDQCLKLWRLEIRRTAPSGSGPPATAIEETLEIAKCECVQTLHAHTAAINCIATLSPYRQQCRQRRRRGNRSAARCVFATGAADATIKVWSLDFGPRNGGADAADRGPDGETSAPTLRLLQTIKPAPKFFPLALALSELADDQREEHSTGDEDGDSNENKDGEGSALVLAAAGTRDIVQIFVADDLGSRDGDAVAHGDAAGPFRLQATLSGHEGWIRSLDFGREEGGGGGNGDLILASASQDKYIRLWRFHAGTELPAVAAAAAEDDVATAYLPGKSPSNKAHRFQVHRRGAGGASSGDYSITFEALLLGHDDWIYSAKWCPPANHIPQTNQNGATATNGADQGSAKRRGLQLLSASADNTLAVWEADPASGIWVTTARLGEISREKGATTATGSTGGFWTGLWGPRQDQNGDGGGGGGASMSVACLGRTGSWRLWSKGGKGQIEGGQDEDCWVPRPGISGHTRAVTGVSWARGGGYLLSTSADQTTRLHAPIPLPIAERAQGRVADTESSSSSSRDHAKKKTWHEMSRPQIHGYDLNCVDALGDAQFVSGADEKLMRVFDEPGAVARLLHRVCGVGGSGSGSGSDPSRNGAAVPDAADMPVLGLSNKAVEGGDDEGGAAATMMETTGASDANETGAGGGRMATSAALDALAGPPGEDALARHTLWPEAEKLYGHGYEVSCLAASHGGGLVASACRASSAAHAVIRLFETAPRWTEVRPPLAAHALTATRLRFSPPHDRFLLSVGRDRVWAVFERVMATAAAEADSDGGGGGDGGGQGRNKVADSNKGPSAPAYRLLQSNPRGHSRMILDAAWAPAPAAEERLVFATAGRDKQVKIWQRREKSATEGEGAGEGEIVLAATIPETHPVTAVDFLPRAVRSASASATASGGDGDALVLAVGTEAGKISLYGIAVGSGSVDVPWSTTLRPE